MRYCALCILPTVSYESSFDFQILAVQGDYLSLSVDFKKWKLSSFLQQATGDNGFSPTVTCPFDQPDAAV